MIPEPVSTGVGRVKSIKDGVRPNFLVIIPRVIFK
jgi:hypothetical protein